MRALLFGVAWHVMSRAAQGLRVLALAWEVGGCKVWVRFRIWGKMGDDGKGRFA